MPSPSRSIFTDYVCVLPLSGLSVRNMGLREFVMRESRLRMRRHRLFSLVAFYFSPLKPKPRWIARCSTRKSRKTGIVAMTATAICSVGGFP